MLKLKTNKTEIHLVLYNSLPKTKNEYFIGQVAMANCEVLDQGSASIVG